MESASVAIIDVGSNSARLVLMDVFPDRTFKLVDELRESLRLADQMTDDMRLTPDAVARTLETAHGFARFCRAQQVSRIRAVATSALRIARNGPEILAQVERETGLKIEVISGDREAYYDSIAVLHTLNTPSCTTLDIGGGSAEVIRIADRAATNMISLPLGAIAVTSAFLDRDRSSADQIRRLEKYLSTTFAGAAWLRDSSEPRVPSLKERSKSRAEPVRERNVLVGMGGTIRNVGKIYQRSVSYPLGLLHGLTVPITAIREIYDTLKGLSLAQRRDVPGLSAGRADIIVGGMAVLATLAEVIGADELVVSGRGLREGLFLSDLAGESTGEVDEPALWATRNLMRYHNVRTEHAEHVSRLAVSIFDQLKPLHGLGDRERRLLGIAGLLHDAGIAVSFYSHGQHGLYLLTQSGIDGLTHRELVTVAYSVASHTGDGSPFKRWPEYRSLLSDRDEEIVLKLGVLLRLCEALDRNEAGSIRSVRCDVASGGSRATLTAAVSGEGDSELRAARGVLPDLERILGVEVSLAT